MQLRNRLVKADFWTDTELARKLPAIGRMMYQGLWQLAEDSGVIEADVFAYKGLLFPFDDIPIKEIEKWTNTLEELGKLIPYKKGKKEYYYIKNFHKHQSLRSPAKPELPLPEWILYVPNDKKRQSGGYIVNYKLIPGNEEEPYLVTVGNVSRTALNAYKDRNNSEKTPNGNDTEPVNQPKGNRTESVRTSYGQTTVTNKNVNVNKNVNKKENVNVSVSSNKTTKMTLGQAYEEYFHRTVNIKHIDIIRPFLDEMEEKVIIEAFKRSEGKDRPFDYAKGILNNWANRDVKVIADVKKLDKEHEVKNKDDPNKIKPMSPERKKELDRYYEKHKEFYEKGRAKGG